jgi:hypothetical protein
MSTVVNNSLLSLITRAPCAPGLPRHDRRRIWSRSVRDSAQRTSKPPIVPRWIIGSCWSSIDHLPSMKDVWSCFKSSVRLGYPWSCINIYVERLRYQECESIRYHVTLHWPRIMLNCIWLSTSVRRVILHGEQLRRRRS